MSLDFLNEVRVVAAGDTGLGDKIDVTFGDHNAGGFSRLGYGGIAVVLGGDSTYGGSANFYLQHSDDNVTYVDVPVELLRNRSAAAVTAGVAGRLGSLAAISLKAIPVTTISKKRYFRVRQGESSAPTGLVSCTFFLFDPVRAPVLLTTW